MRYAFLDVTLQDGQLSCRSAHLHPPLRHYAISGARTLYLHGNPIASQLRNDPAVVRLLEQSATLEQFARGLDGSFVVFVHDPVARTVSFVSDRFGSLPFFYRMEQHVFYASTSFQQLYHQSAQRHHWPNQLDPVSLVEFLCFRRLFGDHTYESHSHFLEGATIVTVDYGTATLQRRRYWQPHFIADQPTRRPPSQQQLAGELADAIRQSVTMYRSDHPRTALLLSGGLDARAILAACGHDRPICFTTAPRQNNEYAVAHQLTTLAGATHHFIPRPVQFLDALVDPAVFAGGGMTIYTEAQFGGYEATIAPQNDVVLVGLALDILLCGHYLPKKLMHLLGHDGYHFHMQPLAEDLAYQFIHTVSYRLKTSDPWSVIRPEQQPRLRDQIYGRITAELDKGRAMGADGYQLWEFMHTHNFARHYSLMMAASIRGYADCRIPAFSNRIYQLMHEMPVDYKANWRVYQKAIALLDPRFMVVKNANTNIRADLPLQFQSLLRWLYGAGNRWLGTVGGRFPRPPTTEDRSWPSFRQSIDVNPSIQKMVRALPHSEALAALNLFDMDRIADTVDDYFSNRHDHSVLLNLLVTLDRFVKSPCRAEEP
ncbi:MAG: hypothetical protein HQL58_05240 [Magnetococcales bacterium]|nr:hypothetical protein [Magnetococcales bacterium]